MRAFEHKPSMAAVDVNQIVESTLTVTANEHRYVADVVTDLAGDEAEASVVTEELHGTCRHGSLFDSGPTRLAEHRFEPAYGGRRPCPPGRCA